MLIDKFRVKRFILYTLLISFLFVIESNYKYPITIYGYKVSLITTVYISIAILDYITEAVFFGIFTGILLDLNYFIVEGINPAFFIVSAVLIYFVSEFFFTKSIATNMLFVGVTLFAHKLIIYVFYYFLVDKANFMIYFELVSPEILISTILSGITYFLVYKISTNNLIKGENDE